MAYRALTDVLQGLSPAIAPGEKIPDTFLNVSGHPQPNDFDRLVEIGAAEKIEPAKRTKAKAEASE